MVDNTKRDPRVKVTLKPYPTKERIITFTIELPESLASKLLEFCDHNAGGYPSGLRGMFDAIGQVLKRDGVKLSKRDKSFRRDTFYFD